MGVKLTGFDELQSHLTNMAAAMKALEGTITSVNFDPNDPHSVESAINEMEAAVDQKLRPYSGDDVIRKVGADLKRRNAEELRERAQHTRDDSSDR